MQGFILQKDGSGRDVAVGTAPLGSYSTGYAGYFEVKCRVASRRDIPRSTNPWLLMRSNASCVLSLLDYQGVAFEVHVLRKLADGIGASVDSFIIATFMANGQFINVRAVRRGE